MKLKRSTSLTDTLLKKKHIRNIQPPHVSAGLQFTLLTNGVTRINITQVKTNFI